MWDAREGVAQRRFRQEKLSYSHQVEEVSTRVFKLSFVSVRMQGVNPGCWWFVCLSSPSLVSGCKCKQCYPHIFTPGSFLQVFSQRVIKVGYIGTCLGLFMGFSQFSEYKVYTSAGPVFFLRVVGSTYQGCLWSNHLVRFLEQCLLRHFGCVEVGVSSDHILWIAGYLSTYAYGRSFVCKVTLLLNTISIMEVEWSQRCTHFCVL